MAAEPCCLRIPFAFECILEDLQYNFCRIAGCVPGQADVGCWRMEVWVWASDVKYVGVPGPDLSLGLLLSPCSPVKRGVKARVCSQKFAHFPKVQHPTPAHFGLQDDEPMVQRASLGMF